MNLTYKIIKTAFISIAISASAYALELSNGKTIWTGMSVDELYESVGRPTARGVKKRTGKTFTQKFTYRIDGKYIDVLVKDNYVIKVNRREYKLRGR